MRYFDIKRYLLEHSQHNFFLMISEPPGAVKNLIGKAKCKSIILEWGRPENDGGMPISKYVLTYGDKSPGKTRNIDGDETSYTISDLKHNTEYSITLRATNPAEWGPTSSVEVKTKEYCKFTSNLI